MQEITRVFLDNEMDVIVAHKRSIRLAELAGLTMSGQTTFATAVSEVSRNAMEDGATAQLVLLIEHGGKDAPKSIVAQIRDQSGAARANRAEGISYASKLVRNITISQDESERSIELRFRIPFSQAITPEKIAQWIAVFNNDLPASPYEEIKRKNRQLVELAEKLRKSEQQYRALSETLPLMIYTWEQARGLTFVNKWTTDFTGFSLEALAGSRWSDVIHPDEYEEIMAKWADAMAAGTPVNNHMRMRGKNGEYVWHMNVMLPQRDEADEIVSWTGFGVDIHAQKVIEQALKDNKELLAAQQLLQANQATLQEHVRLLHQSNEELERFAYVASHDLQEPLRKIILYADYLQKKFAPQLDQSGAVFFDNMIRSTRRMQELIRDLLAFSTVRQETSAFQKVDLGAVAKEAVHDMQETIFEKNATVETEALPIVMGNKVQLGQVFGNLIGNALKYARPDVPPTIRISAAAGENGMTDVSFTDNGIGFEPQYADRIFTLFQRLHSRDQYGGTGIGLAICRRVAELHGGYIFATGRPGEGAVFTISLPALVS